jgi:hypothetical protein
MLSILQLQSTVAEHGGIRPAARELGIAESTIRMRLKRDAERLLKKLDQDAEQETFVFTANRPPRPQVFEPIDGLPRYFIFTAAQDSSKVHEDFLTCLKVYAEWLENCEIMIGGFTYSKTLFEDHDTRSPKVGFHPLIDEYIIHDRIRIGDEVEFCGEMNTLPTAVTPLSGFSTYTGKRWGVFPHPKVQLESVPTMKGDRAKQIMTTGCVTLPNYIRKKAGIKGMFHHVIGAVLVELAPDGSTFCRHLLATSLDDGSFYDLDCHVTRDGVDEGVHVEAITYGDIHEDKLDPVVADTTWGYDTLTKTRVVDPNYTPLCDFLRPNFAFYHDLFDQQRRNHHSIKDPYFRFMMHNKGYDRVEDEVAGSASFLRAVHRDDTQDIVVESNHDQALLRWLKEGDYRTDPANAIFFLESQSWVYRQLASGNSSPPVLEKVLRDKGIPDDTVFISEDQGFVICGSIECGMHGHLGANGTKGSPLTFARAGQKSNTGHTHSPAIRDGAYVAGVSGKLDMGYNKGLSSWAHSHIITYQNGKRTIITMNRGRWYA